MPKVVLIGSPQTQWNIGNSFIPGGTVVELSDAEIKKHKDVVLEIIDKQKKKVKKETKKHTKEELSKKSFSELRKIGNKLKIKFRGKVEAIREILEAEK